MSSIKLNFVLKLICRCRKAWHIIRLKIYIEYKSTRNDLEKKQM